MHTELSSSCRHKGGHKGNQPLPLHLVAGAQPDTTLYAQIDNAGHAPTCTQHSCSVCREARNSETAKNCTSRHHLRSIPRRRRGPPPGHKAGGRACHMSRMGRATPWKPKSNPLKKYNSSPHASTASTTKVSSIPSQEDKATGPAACRCCSTVEIPAGGIRAPEPKQPGLYRPMGLSECQSCPT